MQIEDVTGEQEQEDYSASSNGHSEETDWRAIFSAPNYADLIKTRNTAKSRLYRDKANSVLKAALVGSINAGDFTDAAAILRHGPAFANATGQLAESSDRAAALIDMITSPSNPLAMFVITTIPLVSQLMRNHETQLANVPEAREQAKRQRKAMKAARKAEEPRFTIRLLKWQIPVHWHPKKLSVNKLFAGFKSQTVDPHALVADVFTDDDVMKALAKMGIIITRAGNDQP